MEVVRLSQKAVNKAVEVINHGGVVICPTDTVYGFLADASNKKAVEKIFKLKKRPRSKPLAVFVRDLKMARELAKIDEKQEKILKKYWPGKFTFVLKRRNPCEIGSHTKLYGVDKKTIALRIPKYKFLNDLLKKINPVRNGVSNGVNKPLAQTSVNISGEPALIKISDIINQLNRTDVLVVNGGNIKKNKSSKVLDLTKDKIKILRE